MTCQNNQAHPIHPVSDCIFTNTELSIYQIHMKAIIDKLFYQDAILFSAVKGCGVYPFNCFK